MSDRTQLLVGAAGGTISAVRELPPPRLPSNALPAQVLLWRIYRCIFPPRPKGTGYPSTLPAAVSPTAVSRYDGVKRGFVEPRAPRKPDLLAPHQVAVLLSEPHADPVSRSPLRDSGLFGFESVELESPRKMSGKSSDADGKIKVAALLVTLRCTGSATDNP